jgi:hypothetical protein
MMEHIYSGGNKWIALEYERYSILLPEVFRNSALFELSEG